MKRNNIDESNNDENRQLETEMNYRINFLAIFTVTPRIR